ncbi:hypothetical protein ACWEKM_46220 [Streptomyces sp. NPDC004752]
MGCPLPRHHRKGEETPWRTRGFQSRPRKPEHRSRTPKRSRPVTRWPSWRAASGTRTPCGCHTNSWTWSGRSSSWVGPWVCAPATPARPWQTCRSTGGRLTARSSTCCCPSGWRISLRSQWRAALTRSTPALCCGRRSGITAA